MARPPEGGVRRGGDSGGRGVKPSPAGNLFQTSKLPLERKPAAQGIGSGELALLASAAMCLANRSTGGRGRTGTNPARPPGSLSDSPWRAVDAHPNDEPFRRLRSRLHLVELCQAPASRMARNSWGGRRSFAMTAAMGNYVPQSRPRSTARLAGPAHWDSRFERQPGRRIPRRVPAP